MKHVNCLVIFAICFNYSALAQIKINFKGDGLNSKLKLQLYEGGTCAQAKMEGVEGKSSVDLNVGLAIGATDLFLTGLGKIILDDASINPSDILSFTPQFNCSYHILNVHGQINSYMYNSFYDKVLVKTVSGDVSYDDKIQVYSPVATTLELPFEASASVVAVQTFCNPDGSKATARAELTVTCGNQSATAGGTAEVIGAFLDNQYPNDKEKVQVSVPAGVSTFPLHITGTLFTESAVQGLSPLNVILCGSNAVASAGNSLTVKYFTGLNGAPLPQGIKINGLITGVDYLNPQQSSNCLKFPVPDIKVTDASCGNANGMATITISGVGQPQFEWDNGKTGATATGFAAGAHYVIVRDSNGCSATYPFEVHDPYRPSVLLPVDLQLATGQTATLNAADTTGGQYNYAWSTGAATPAITVNTPGIYTVTLTNSAGCLFIYQTLVVDKPGYYFSDGDITTDLSLFFDDGGPNKNYSPNQSNVIKICPATVGKFAVLEFTEVDILNTNDQDELSVFDGTGSICPLNSNVTSPGIYTASVSSGGCLTVRFRATDFDAEGKGWKALIKTTDTPPAGCFRQIQTCSGVLEDSGGAGNPYTAQEYQIYTICPPEPNDNPHFITLDFSEVEIGAGDHLAIYDGKGVNCILEDSLTLPRKFTASNRSGGVPDRRF